MTYIISKIGLTFQKLSLKPMAYFVWPWCLPGGYSAQAIKECIDYELKSTNNPYVLTKFWKLLSLAYYSPGWCTTDNLSYTIFSFSLRRSIMQTVYYLTRKRGQYTTNTVPWGFIWLNSLVKISLIRLWPCNQNGSNVASCQSFVSLAVASVSHTLLILHNYRCGV
jgi:hypothetical protein